MQSTLLATTLGKVASHGLGSVTPKELRELRALLALPASRKFAAARLAADWLGVGTSGPDLSPTAESLEFDSWFKKVLRGAAKVAGALGYGPMQEEGSKAFRKLVGAEVEPTPAEEAAEEALEEGESSLEEDDDPDGPHIECDGPNCLNPCHQRSVAESTHVLMDRDRDVLTVAGALPTLLYREYGAAGPLQLGKYLSSVLRQEGNRKWSHNFEVREDSDGLAEFDDVRNRRASFLAVAAPSGIARIPRWSREPVGTVISPESGDGIAHAAFAPHRPTQIPRRNAALVHLTSLSRPVTEFDKEFVKAAAIEFFKFKKVFKKLKKLGKGLLKLAGPVLSTIIPGGGLVTGMLGNLLGGSSSKGTRPAAATPIAPETPDFSSIALSGLQSLAPGADGLANRLRRSVAGALPFDPAQELLGAGSDFVARRREKFLPAIDDEMLASYSPSRFEGFPHEVFARPESHRLIPRRRRPAPAPLARYVPSMMGEPLASDYPEDIPPSPPPDWAPREGRPPFITENRVAVPWWGGTRYVDLAGQEGGQ